MIKVNLTYADASCTVHTNPGCQHSRGSTRSRSVSINEANLQAGIDRFGPKFYEFAPFDGLERLSVEIDLAGDTDAEITAADMVLNFLGGYYHRFKHCNLHVHCLPKEPTHVGLRPDRAEIDPAPDLLEIPAEEPQTRIRELIDQMRRGVRVPRKGL